MQVESGNPREHASRRTRTRTESSVELLHKAQLGDAAALDRLCNRYLPMLQRWARGRVPAGARGMLETDDLVQETIVRTLKNLSGFEHRRDGALLAYLRTTLHNRVREEARRLGRRPTSLPLADDAAGPSVPNALDHVVTQDEMARYEKALRALRDVDREAIIARLEMGLPYEHVADILGKPSTIAARKAVSRAVSRLARALHDRA